MAWLRLDDGFMGNAKIVQLTDRELRVWMRVLCYCAKAKDPTVDRFTRNEVPGLTSTAIRRFVEIGLLDEVNGCHEVHDWMLFQPKDPTAHERMARWRSRRSGVTPTVTPTVTNGVTETVTEPLLARAVPSRPEESSSSTSDVDHDPPFAEELGISRLLSVVGDVDEDALAKIRGFARRLPEGSLAKVAESVRLAAPRNRVGYALRALGSELREQVRS